MSEKITPVKAADAVNDMIKNYPNKKVTFGTFLKNTKKLDLVGFIIKYHDFKHVEVLDILNDFTPPSHSDLLNLMNVLKYKESSLKIERITKLKENQKKITEELNRLEGETEVKK